MSFTHQSYVSSQHKVTNRPLARPLLHTVLVHTTIAAGSALMLELHLMVMLHLIGVGTRELFLFHFSHVVFEDWLGFDLLELGFKVGGIGERDAVRSTTRADGVVLHIFEFGGAGSAPLILCVSDRALTVVGSIVMYETEPCMHSRAII